MNDQSLNQNDKPVKPCIRCGATDRYASGGCKPCVKAKASNWYKENNKKAKESRKKWYEENKKIVREANKKWIENNKEKNRIIHLEWNKRNKKCLLDANKKWKANNKDIVKTHNNNRRARKNNNGGKLSANIIDALLLKQRGKCACCGNPLNGEYHLDHIMPLARGGTNTDDNVQLLLPKCNMSKGAKHPIDYMREKGKLL